MLEKVFVDTMFVLALANENDPYHAQAVELADDYDAEQYVITDAVLLEVGNALSRQHRREAAKLIEYFLSTDDVEVVRLTPKMLEDALALYKKYHDKTWSLVDCISFVVMKQKGIRLALTFDQHFKQAGFRALMRE